MITKIIFCLYAAFIAGVSLLPAETYPDVKLWDKGSHFIAYLIFCLLAGALSKEKKTLLILALSIIVYSGIIEVGQFFIPGRMMSGLDLLANSLGVLAGLLLLYLIKGRSKCAGNNF